MKPTETLFAGEAQLAGWSDTHNGGAKITFWLPSADDLDKFRALTVRKGNTAGHLVMLAVVEHDGEGTPIPPPEPTKQHEPQKSHARATKTNGPYCIEAIDLCRTQLFWKWAEGEAGVPVRNEEQAKQFILSILGIGSRKDIDGDAGIVDTFINDIRIPFMHWQREQVEDQEQQP